jgi:hypothetical protein
VRELVLASGPDRYFGGAIETFALPYGAFIVISLALWYIFRHPHSVPRMKYLSPAHQTSLGTREPGTTGMVTLADRMPSSAPAAEADTSVPAGQPPHVSEAHPDASEVIPDPAARAGESAAGGQQEGDV